MTPPRASVGGARRRPEVQRCNDPDYPYGVSVSVVIRRVVGSFGAEVRRVRAAGCGYGFSTLQIRIQQAPP